MKLLSSCPYDKNGNRTTVTRGGVASAYSVDNNDKLLSGDGFTFANYSADGNPASATVPGTGTVAFTYDPDNRIKTTALPSRTNSFKYNADGQRVEQVSSQGTRRYVYDGWTIIAETDGAGTILTYFLPGVGYVSGTTQFYYRDNALGSTVAVTNATGIVQSLTEYDAYGIEYTVQAGANSQFRFAGKHGYQTDTDTGLDLLGHRYYAAKLGRFLTQDPLGHAAGLNLYAYCNNGPLVAVDPDGLDTRKLTGAERTNLGIALQLLKESGGSGRGVALGYQMILRANPDTIMIDTEIGGAVWRYNTLYIDKNILSFWVDWQSASGKLRSDRMISNFDEKAWAASILYHEFVHVAHNETYMMMKWSQGSAESRAWGGQQAWLLRLQGQYSRDPQRTEKLHGLILKAGRQGDDD